jgi:hypothetical protein
MQKDNLKGGKSDNLSLEDIAKKHGVGLNSIKTQIEIGKKIELEHVNCDDLAEEIAKDHLEEFPDYYTRLKDMEKQAKKELNLESKRLMALAGIKEGNKKFLTNESFTESESKPIINKKDNDDFIVLELDHKGFESGQDDDTLYKLG